MTLKFLVMSDLHLVPEGKTSVTLDTAARLEAAVARANEKYGDFDFCILAGDLADMGEAAAYVRLQTILAAMTIPVHITLGNHDHRPTFLDVFGAGMASETGNVDFVIDAKGYRIIVLDSSEPGRVDGVLEAAQIDWLLVRLAEAADRPVIVVLHHNANAMHVDCIDTIKLMDEAPLLAALKTHPDVRQVIAGHVHLTSVALHHGISFVTLAGGHYSNDFKIDAPDSAYNLLTGPGQMAVVLADPDTVTVLFDDFIDGNAVIIERTD